MPQHPETSSFLQDEPTMGCHVRHSYSASFEVNRAIQILCLRNVPSQFLISWVLSFLYTRYLCFATSSKCLKKLKCKVFCFFTYQL
ncbi:uncharacterized protein LOC113340567 isoform X2 [Papaver somniferum]|uniref:uncharacterized protein LOC113340567 isoform X2 n=1 Tax=Papaver somniferum TaxID=3469 RepID=UPI000E6FE2CA|nr:uncharacterized protein LOC113340567 isoform X2 [Papaver somniferum]